MLFGRVLGDVGPHEGRFEAINASADKTAHLYCIYVAVGQKRSTVAQLFEILRKNATWRSKQAAKEYI